MNKESLLNLTKYNFWANTKVLEFVYAAGEEKADIVQNSSFPTVRKTLYHLWDAETIWSSRLMGKHITDWPSKSFNGNFDELKKLLPGTSEIFVNFVIGIDDSGCAKSINYKTLDGKEYSNSVTQIIMHCMNHSTFHRGQIITMLRNVGHTNFSSTDYIAFCRLK